MKLLTKRSISIILILLSLHILINTFNIMRISEGTKLHISIKANFDIKDIKDLVVAVTQDNPKKINVELDQSNTNEVIIKTSLMEENVIDKLILRLEENYGDNIEILMLTNINTTADSKNRQIALITIFMTLIVIIVILLTRNGLKRKG